MTPLVTQARVCLHCHLLDLGVDFSCRCILEPPLGSVLKLADSFEAVFAEGRLCTQLGRSLAGTCRKGAFAHSPVAAFLLVEPSKCFALSLTSLE